MKSFLNALGRLFCPTRLDLFPVQPDTPVDPEERTDAPPLLSVNSIAPVHIDDEPEPREKPMILASTLFKPHKFHDSVPWHVTPNGVSVDGMAPEVWGGEPTTVRRIWAAYGGPIRYESQLHGVPVELVIACIATESKGNPNALRLEPGYVSDEETPDRVSPGLMQTLISTAREALRNPNLRRAYLMTPTGSIAAGVAYMAHQHGVTKFDPPKVAAAYNAGGVYLQNGLENRWKMRQYPIGTGAHVDRFIKWFNECMLMFRLDGGAPRNSFARYTNQ